MGEDKFARLARSHGFQCLRVDDFGEEMIFVEVGTLLAFALVADAGTGNLAQAVDVVCLDA